MAPVPTQPASRVIDDEEDYEYFWSTGGLDFRIPRWLAEILDVPLIVRVEIFMVGVCSGLLLGALAVVIGLYSAM